MFDDIVFQSTKTNKTGRAQITTFSYCGEVWQFFVWHGRLPGNSDSVIFGPQMGDTYNLFEGP